MSELSQALNYLSGDLLDMFSEEIKHKNETG
jgi:hypothetical protein